LDQAWYEALQHCPDALKQHRSEVLDYLEPQYQRIVQTSKRVTEFIKNEKRARRVLGLEYCGAYKYNYNDKRLLAEGLLILEDYNGALKQRDLPEETRINTVCDNLQEQSEAQYDRLPCENAMRDLQLSWKARDCEGCCEKFKKAFDKMDKQYMDIRKARKELFKWDFLHMPGIEIDINSPAVLIDESINWDADELELFPSSESYGKSSSDDDSS